MFLHHCLCLCSDKIHPLLHLETKTIPQTYLFPDSLNLLFRSWTFSFLSVVNYSFFAATFTCSFISVCDHQLQDPVHLLLIELLRQLSPFGAPF